MSVLSKEFFRFNVKSRCDALDILWADDALVVYHVTENLSRISGFSGNRTLLVSALLKNSLDVIGYGSIINPHISLLGHVL